MVNIEVGQAKQLRLGREQSRFQSFGHVETGYRILRLATSGNTGTAPFWLLGVDGKADRSVVAAGLGGSTLIESGEGFQFLIAFRDLKTDNRVGVRADPRLEGPTVHPQRPPLAILVHLHTAPAGSEHRRLERRQRELAFWSHQPGIRPIGPVMTETIPPVIDDEIKLLESANVDRKWNSVIRCRFGDDLAAKQRLRFLSRGGQS